MSTEWLTPWLSEAHTIFAADAGADLVLRCGFVPDFLVGDLDSVSPEGAASAREVVDVFDQDHSDFEKLLGLFEAKKISRAILCGLEGTRVDHMIHAVQVVARWKGQCLLAYESMLGRIVNGGESIHVATSAKISALPLEPCTGVSMVGVEWPLDRVEMSPCGFSSISNRGLGNTIISLESGKLFVLSAYDGRPSWDFHEDIETSDLDRT